MPLGGEGLIIGKTVPSLEFRQLPLLTAEIIPSIQYAPDHNSLPKYNEIPELDSMPF